MGITWDLTSQEEKRIQPQQAFGELNLGGLARQRFPEGKTKLQKEKQPTFVDEEQLHYECSESSAWEIRKSATNKQ